MPESDDQMVYVLTAAPTRTGPNGRPIHLRTKADGPSIVGVPMNSFKEGMSNFMNSVRSLVGDIEHKAGEYEIEQLEIAASIGVDGKISFFGSGAGIKTAASFTLTLTKPKT